MPRRKAPPASSLVRSALLAGAGASILAKELGSLARSAVNKKVEELKEQTRIEQIRILTDSLSHLKGSAMKFGQLLSFEAQDLLPPEAVEILSKLHKNADPIDNSTLFNLVKKDLGNKRFQLLHLTPEPIASASIGQVYKGEVNGLTVAVKVQFPKVRESISSDIATLRGMIPVALTILGKKVNFDGLLKELESVLLLETDYLREADNLEQYQKMLSDDSRYYVPKPLREFSSKHVLTMDFVEGVHLRDWISGKPSFEDRQRVAEAILDLYITEFFKNGFVQTDPNLANFLVRTDANNRPQLILLDCGAALKYSPTFIARYKNLVQTLSDESESSIIKHCEEAEFLDSRESQDVKQLFVAMVRASVIPFQNQHQPFDFANKEYSKQIRDLVIEFSRRSRFTGPPQEFIFLHRKLGGVFHILKMLESKIDLSPYWAKAFDRSKTIHLE